MAFNILNFKAVMPREYSKFCSGPSYRFLVSQFTYAEASEYSAQASYLANSLFGYALVLRQGVASAIAGRSPTELVV
jgi:hypothetical protein